MFGSCLLASKLVASREELSSMEIVKGDHFILQVYAKKIYVG
jgi:hypothetical protein